MDIFWLSSRISNGHEPGRNRRRQCTTQFPILQGGKRRRVGNMRNNNSPVVMALVRRINPVFIHFWRRVGNIHVDDVKRFSNVYLLAVVVVNVFLMMNLYWDVDVDGFVVNCNSTTVSCFTQKRRVHFGWKRSERERERETNSTRKGKRVCVLWYTRKY